MTYFAKVTALHHPRSKAQQVAQELIKKADRRVFSDNARARNFKRGIAAQLAIINKRNPTCRPVQLSKRHRGQAEDVYIGIDGVIHMSIYKSEKQEI